MRMTPTTRTHKSLWIALVILLCFIFAPAALQASGSARTVKRTSKPNAATKRNAVLPLIDLAGYQKLLTKYRGKPLVVNFWATWCEPCRSEYPMLVGLAKQYQPKGVVFIGVSFDADADLDVVSHFLAMYHPDFPNYRQKPGIDVDGFNHAIDPAWDGSIPSTIFYKPNGQPDVQFYGTRPRAEFEKEIQRLMANPFAARWQAPRGKKTFAHS